MIRLIALGHKRRSAWCQLGTGKSESILLFMDDLNMHGSNEREANRLANSVRIFTVDINEV